MDKPTSFVIGFTCAFLIFFALLIPFDLMVIQTNEYNTLQHNVEEARDERDYWVEIAYNLLWSRTTQHDSIHVFEAGDSYYATLVLLESTDASLVIQYAIDNTGHVKVCQGMYYLNERLEITESNRYIDCRASFFFGGGITFRGVENCTLYGGTWMGGTLGGER